MWVWTQGKKGIVKVDSIFTVRGHDISTWVGKDLIVLGLYGSPKEVDEVYQLFWDALANRSTMFRFPEQI